MDFNENRVRVRLISSTDPYNHIELGTKGTVIMIDSNGTVHVKYDNGSVLGLIPGQDEWEYLSLDVK